MIKSILSIVSLIGLAQCQFQPQQSYNFTGKAVLITGSSSGIGAEIARQFSSLGANVVITGRNATEIAAVAAQAEKLSPKKLKPLQVKADLSKQAELEGLLNETIKTFGRLDVLVNNAAAGGFASLSDPKTFISDFDMQVSVNLRAPILLSILAAPHLRATNGSIISTSSVYGKRPYLFSSSNTTINSLSYSATKAGIDIMTESLALELGPNVRVNTVSPGYIDSGALFRHGFDPKVIEQLTKQWVQKTPLKRAGRVEDIAKAVLFLASDQAQFITGDYLVVDGGSSWNSGS